MIIWSNIEGKWPQRLLKTFLMYITIKEHYVIAVLFISNIRVTLCYLQRLHNFHTLQTLQHIQAWPVAQIPIGALTIVPMQATQVKLKQLRLTHQQQHYRHTDRPQLEQIQLQEMSVQYLLLLASMDQPQLRYQQVKIKTHLISYLIRI